MATRWLFAPVRDADPSLHGVFLASELGPPDPHVTRYLVGKFGNQLMPIGIDRFTTLKEAQERCLTDFALRNSTVRLTVSGFGSSLFSLVGYASE